jgi:protein-S-isoprenylcysteine O-methyltransferase Ste14
MKLRDKAIDFIFTTARGNTRKRAVLTIVIAAAFTIVTSLFIIIPLFLERLLGMPKFWSTPLNYNLSLPFIIAGLILLIGSILQYVNVNGTPVPVNPPPKLITTGLFAYSRNPMHTGLFLLLFGLGIYYISLLSILVFIPLYILIDIKWIKSVEEPELEKRLGKEYIEYKKRTPMFFGWRKK